MASRSKASAACRRRSTRLSEPWRQAWHDLARSERRDAWRHKRLIRSLSPSLERQTRAREKAPDQPLARLRLSDSSGDPAVTKASSITGPTTRTSHAAWQGSSGVAERQATGSSPLIKHCGSRLRSDARNAACAVRSLRHEDAAQAPNRKRSVRGFSQSACLPFQALGKAPDRAPECLAELWERPRIERLNALPSSGKGPGPSAESAAARTDRR